MEKEKERQAFAAEKQEQMQLMRQIAEQQREIDRLNFEQEKKELEHRLSSKFIGHSAVGPAYAPGFGSLETVMEVTEPAAPPGNLELGFSSGGDSPPEPSQAKAKAKALKKAAAATRHVSFTGVGLPVDVVCASEPLATLPTAALSDAAVPARPAWTDPEEVLAHLPPVPTVTHLSLIHI